jgi:hypothetical protein
MAAVHPGALATGALQKEDTGSTKSKSEITFFKIGYKIFILKTFAIELYCNSIKTAMKNVNRR